VFSISENSPNNTVVGEIVAKDPEGELLTYSIISGNTNNVFTIQDGKIKVANLLDYETIPSYNLTVVATDKSFAVVSNVVVNILEINENPTDMAIANSTIDENQSVGSVIGDFSSTDPDGDTSFTYQLVSGNGDTDNAKFEIVGNKLQSKAIFDYETQDTFSIRVETKDQDGASYQKEFVVTVNNLNEAPTDVFLNNKTIDENQAVDPVVGNLTNLDPDLGDTHTYTLVSVDGENSNLPFKIVGNQLLSNKVFDFETKSSYTIEVQTEDAGGKTLAAPKQMVININDLPDTAIEGDAKDNNINGTAGDDTVYGWGGNDILKGLQGNDVLDGEIGNDKLYGEAGNDTLNGGAGNDLLDGGLDDDQLTGGAGNDSYFVDSPNDQVFENPGEGTDVVNASINYILGENFERLFLTSLAEINATGNNLSNIIKGNSKNNVIEGLAGNDQLLGYGGNDTILME